MATELATMVADFRTTLATEIAIGGTSGTLQSITDADGNTLANGTYYFTLDGDGTAKEHIKCTLTGTALSNIRTVSRKGVQASGTVRKHRIGAMVQITNFAHIKYMLDLLDGTTDFDASTPLKYDGVPTITSGMVETLATVDYVNGVALAGAPDAQTNVKGVVELATVAEQGTAEAVGSTGAALIPANANLVKTSSGADDENKIAILNASGVFADGFLDAARTWTTVQSFTADNLQITTDPDSANDAVRLGAILVRPHLGDGSDGDVTISSPTTLSRDMFYNTLTLTGANDVTTAGYKIFVKRALTRNEASTAKIKNNGGAGGNAVGGTAGAAGTAGVGATLPAGTAGAAGAGGLTATSNTTGVNGSAGGAASPTLSPSNGAAGGAGGSGNTGIVPACNGGSGGAGGTATESKSKPRNLLLTGFFELSGGSITVQKLNAGSGSGGSGGVQSSGTSATGGGGGGSGGGGGCVFVAAGSIIDNGTGTMFEAIGGNGGNGGNGSGSGTTGSGGGGGGGGGNGGIILRVYNTLTGAASTSVAGGAGGAGGLRDATGSSALDVDGTAGAAGAAGVLFDITN